MPRNSSQLRRDPRSEALLWLARAEIRCGAEKERLAQKYGTEQKKKRIVVGFFFQFRDDCESKRALTNFFLPATKVWVTCIINVIIIVRSVPQLIFRLLTSFFPPGCCETLWNFETEGKGRLKSWNGCRDRGRDCSGMSVIPSFGRSNLGWCFETR